MTLALRYAVRSDVGLLREGNEDSAYAGPRLLAVADGMGGHAAGEVASAVTIGAMAELDTDRYAGTDLLADLSNAVASANMRLQQMIIANPAVEGMGTTLTAVLWFDGHAAVCHIGDSRGYLLRAGQLYQITHDHTLVQSLVDEGRITEDDVSTHPQRSLLLRALDGRTVAEPDLSVHEAQPGDRYLLCSDGLSGVVSDETLRDTLAGFQDPDAAARQLIDLAIRGGGPDNITCIVADVVELGPGSGPVPVQGPTLAGAAAHGTDPRAILASTNPFAAQVGLTGMTRAMPGPRAARTAPQPILTDDNAPAPNGDQPASRRGHRRETAPRETRRRKRWPIVTTALVVLLAVIVAGGYFAWQATQDQYYIAADKSGQVTVYRGINQSIAGISLSHPYSQTGIMLDQVPTPYRNQVANTISASSLTDANNTVTEIKSKVTACEQYYSNLASWNKAKAAHNAAVTETQKSHHPPIKIPPAPSGPQPTEPAGLSCAAAGFYPASGSS
ncbi:MAG TPA: protein phosphatase 2C domain-containing protein [Streptosporangiaceae bacterium]|nr:protein phosphatase 2C domain-containing protein [Streptosporangiaceae bacterium]